MSQYVDQHGAIRDLTPAQAARWVTQEFDKTIKHGTVNQRIAAERQVIVLAPELGLDLPNSLKAHQDLLVRLQAHKEKQS